METKTNENLFEGIKTNQKWFNDSATAMMEIYNRQLNLTMSFYDNLFSMFPAFGNVWSRNKNLTEAFNANTDLGKWMWRPFTIGNVVPTNPFMDLFDKTYKQLLEYNRNLFSSFTETELEPIGKKYQESITSQLEASKKITNSIQEAFNKQLEVAAESDKKLLDEINGQFNTLMKQNQEFWTAVLNANKAALEKEKAYKEDGGSAVKKQGKPVAVS